MLLDNAVRYSHPGGLVRVRLQLCADAGEAPFAELEVQDHGIGIAESDLPRLFERQFRGELARRHRADGTGLGLAIAASLTRVHGGDIRMESREGEGSTVRLRLPLSEPS